MSSLYEKSQGTKIQITSVPATPETVGSATYLDLQCTIKEVQFTGGQKQDIDVTLCSTEQENINGLGAQSEISLSGNFYNPAQDALRERMTTTPHTVSKSFSLLGSASSSWLKFASTPGHQVQTASWPPHSRCV
jgi:hypothetical protein